MQVLNYLFIHIGIIYWQTQTPPLHKSRLYETIQFNNINVYNERFRI